MSASNSREPTIFELRERAEQSRARLSGTVEQLRTQVDNTAAELKERLSPSAIKADVADYVRDSRDQLWNRVEASARNNPLQAVAVGAAVAYPAVKLLRAIPAPLLLIGAGLFLSRARPPEGFRSASQVGVETARGAMDKAGDAIARATDASRRAVHDATNAIKDAAESVKGHASDISSLSENSTGLGVGEEPLDATRSREDGLLEKARKGSATLGQNPLVVAGAGLAVGAILAAAFPATRAEKVAVGGAKDALRRAAGEVAAKGASVVEESVERAASAARDEGLSVEGINTAGDAIKGKLREVAEKGIEAVLPASSASDIQDSNSSVDKRS